MPIKEIVFGPKRYLTLRKSIATSQISDKHMYDEAGKKLALYIEQNGLHHEGGWSVLYFLWDEPNQKAEIGISFPITDLNPINDPEQILELTVTDIPESKA